MIGSPKHDKKAQAPSQAQVTMTLLKMRTQKHCKDSDFLTQA